MRKDTETQYDDVPRLGASLAPTETDAEEQERLNKGRDWDTRCKDEGGVEAVFRAELLKMLETMTHETSWSTSKRVAFLLDHARKDGWPKDARRMITTGLVRLYQEGFEGEQQEEAKARNKRLPRGIRMTKKELEQFAELRQARM